MATKAMAPMDNYQAQDDHRTAVNYHKMRMDPARHKAMLAENAKQLAAMKAVGQPIGGPTVEGKEPKGKKDAEDMAEMKGKKK